MADGVAEGGVDGVRVGLSPIASPLPLTFAGLLIASVIFSGVDLGWIPKPEHREAGWVLLAVPLPLQLLAAWWGFNARSASAATGSGIMTALWLALALDLIHARPPAHGPSNAAGLLALAVAAALLAPALAELRLGALLPGAVLVLAGVRFAVTGVSGLTHAAGWADASGWLGVAVATAALYATVALELESTAQDPLLPTFRRRLARRALAARLEQQVADVEHEPGVRRVL